MNVFSNFEKQLKLISKFNGICLNIEEKLKLEIGLKELMSKTKNELLHFWGKITGEDNDYYIAVGINFTGHYSFPEKNFYYSTPTFNFEILPETFAYHDNDFTKYYYDPLKGNPDFIIKQYKLINLDGDNAEPEVKQDENEENAKPKILDPDASVDDNAPKPEEPKENFTEKLKLSYLVRQIDYDTSIVPEGAFVLTNEHEIRINRSFKGISINNINDKSKWMHFRPISESKTKEIEEDNAVFKTNIFDSINNDTVKGSWSLQLDTTKTSCNIRSLLWPGYFAAHIGNSNLYCGVYIGNGMKRGDLPFMI